MKYKVLYINTLLAIYSINSFGQENWEGVGEIEEAEVVIEKDRQIVLPRATRIFERVPPFEQQTGILGLDYSFAPINFIPGLLNTRIRPLTIQPQRLSAVRTANLKLGYGNYSTPYFEGSAASGRNDEYLFTAYLRHRSSATGPVDEKNSGDSHSMLDLNGQLYLNEATVSGKLMYEREAFHFYGYDQSLDVGRDSIKQVFNMISLFGRIENNFPDKEAKYMANATFEYIQDELGSAEAEFGMNLFGRIPVNDSYKVDIQSDFYIINRKDNLLPSYNRYFLRIKPFLVYSLDNLEAKLGFSTVFENDTLSGSKSVRFFPFVNVNYQLGQNAIVYGGYRGDVDKRSLKDFLRQNRYMASNVLIFNQIRTFDFYAGIKGNLARKWDFDLGTSLVYWKNPAYFINSSVDTTKFEIAYDTESSNYNQIFASLGYDLKDNVYVNVRADNYFYKTTTLAEAWHRPSYKVKLFSRFGISEKFNITADSYIMGGIKALEVNTGQTVELDPIIDISAGLEYLISNQASLFANAYNLLGNQYQRYLNYPSRELQVIAGLSYSF